MTRVAVSENYPVVPEGFSLMWEYDPDAGLSFFRVKFTAQIEQVVTDELLATSSLTPELLCGTAVRELESSIARRFR